MPEADLASGKMLITKAHWAGSPAHLLAQRIGINMGVIAAAGNQELGKLRNRCCPLRLDTTCDVRVMSFGAKGKYVAGHSPIPSKAKRRMQAI